MRDLGTIAVNMLPTKVVGLGFGVSGGCFVLTNCFPYSFPLTARIGQWVLRGTLSYGSRPIPDGTALLPSRVHLSYAKTCWQCRAYKGAGSRCQGVTQKNSPKLLFTHNDLAWAAVNAEAVGRYQPVSRVHN